jgi:PPOX class probable F420-dependent enzyme
MTLGNEKYVLVTTFRKTGAAVATTTWIAPLENGRVGFWTSSSAGKAKRLRNNPRLRVQPSDSRGRPKADSPAVEGTAALVNSGPDFDTIQTKIKAKYGVMVAISRIFNTLGHLGKGSFPYGDLAVIITLDT